MKAKIISDNKLFIKSLDRYLSVVFSGIEVNNLVLIDVNTILNDSQKRQDRVGVALAKEYVNDSKNIIILLSVEDEASLMKNNNDFSGLMTFSNVGFVDVLAVRNILPKYKEISSGQKRQDSTGLAIYEFEELQKNISVWRHNLSHVEQQPKLLSEWLQKARAAGLTGSDQEIVKYVKNWNPETSGEFKDKFLEGIFVDAFETLFDKDWKLVSSVREAVQKISDKNKSSVFIISDSDKSLLEPKLNDNNISWRLLSKYDIRGVTLEIVIDNLSQKDFESTYDIKAKKFINVQKL